jgi:RimJ/RimL family protein N-acetyltransferase
MPKRREGDNHLMTPLAPLSLDTPRLHLRQFTLADVAAYAQMCADPEVMRYIGTGEPQPADVTWRSVAGMLGQWQLLGYGMWAVTRREDGVLLGRAGFLDPPGWPGFELGYLFAREHWGKGYAREAAGAALRIAREELRKPQVISLIRPANAASIRLAISLGGVLERTLQFMGGDAQVFAYRWRDAAPS